MAYKNPNSILVVIYEQQTKQILMLRRKDDPDFWQSVTGSIDIGETPYQTAIREVKEETGIDILAENLPLFDCQEQIEFEIFPHFRYKYAPNVTHCTEHWFLLPLREKSAVCLTEHSAYQWVSPKAAVKLTKSPNNAQVIEKYIIVEGKQNGRT
ncbi:dihydroneopterin triphosphate diphosphatase [Caviibacterium pharyngocola]|uniref:Dihydroneopterin triphosphate diphosphatase n=1 Tax=Caviibacterium pharyngocola TaxID=28159 RepID=A0A2M8RXX3_9PAST|nr:dihydroneopterin triphosphate diphosphatase [Caviibacterium pharyngocola]PJG83743.1 dihydroneopterin triphosphate diphosphatase [Caviibacterium pharyngocola]